MTATERNLDSYKTVCCDLANEKLLWEESTKSWFHYDDRFEAIFYCPWCGNKLIHERATTKEASIEQTLERFINENKEILFCVLINYWSDNTFSLTGATSDANLTIVVSQVIDDFRAFLKQKAGKTISNYLYEKSRK